MRILVETLFCMEPCSGVKFELRMFRVFFFFQAEDGIRDLTVTGVQTCALPIFQIQAHDVAHLVDELRVGRELEGLGAVRLQPEGAPDAADRTLAHAGRDRHRARRSEERRVGKECRSRWSPYH